MQRSFGGFSFKQVNITEASSNWVVRHDLGYIPQLETKIIDGGVVKKAKPLSIEHVDENTVSVTWSSPQIGFISVLIPFRPPTTVAADSGLGFGSEENSALLTVISSSF